MRLHEEQPGHHGIIACTLDLDFAGQARRIDDAIAKSIALAGKLLRVDRLP